MHPFCIMSWFRLKHNFPHTVYWVTKMAGNDMFEKNGVCPRWSRCSWILNNLWKTLFAWPTLSVRKLCTWRTVEMRRFTPAVKNWLIQQIAEVTPALLIWPGSSWPKFFLSSPPPLRDRRETFSTAFFSKLCTKMVVKRPCSHYVLCLQDNSIWVTKMQRWFM